MDVSKHVEKAKEAIRKKNYDYAISLFREILEIKPDQVEARRGLREAEFKKYAKRYPPLVLRLLQGLPSLILILLYSKLKKPKKVLAACEGFLRFDPKSRRVNSILASSALALGFQETAILVLETLVEAYPDDIQALNNLGKLYYRKGDLGQAMRFYEKTLKIDSGNQEAIRARKNLAAEGALIETGFQTASSSAELIKDKEKQKELLRKERIVKTEKDVSILEKELGEKLEKDPGDSKTLMKMARLLSERERYEEALSFLDKILHQIPDDYETKIFSGDLRIRILSGKLAKAEGEGNEERGRALRKEKNELEIQEYLWRVEEHPTDLELRYKLGRSLYQGDRIDEAIAAFQKSLNDPRLRVDSLIMLGNAFLRKGMYELAANQFSKALDDLSSTSRKGMEVRYSLGSIYERMGDSTKAKEEFARIYEVDISFRDISKKMEDYSQMENEKKE